MEKELPEQALDGAQEKTGRSKVGGGGKGSRKSQSHPREERNLEEASGERGAERSGRRECLRGFPVRPAGERERSSFRRVEAWDEADLQGRRLLGRESDCGRPGARPVHGQQSGNVEAGPTRNSVRGPGEVGRSPPEAAVGGPFVWTRLWSTSKRRSSTCGERPAIGERPTPALDGQLGGGSPSSAFGRRRTWPSPRTSRAEREAEERGVTEDSVGFGPQFPVIQWGRKEEEEKEEEKEVQRRGKGEGEDVCNQGLGGSFRAYGARSQTSGKEEDPAEGAQGGQEENVEGKDEFWEFRLLQRESELRGNRGKDVRRGGPGQDSVESSSGGFDSQHSGAYSGDGCEPDRTDVEHRHLITSSALYPVLEAQPPEQSQRSDGQGDAFSLFRTRFASSRKNRIRNRCDYTEAERIGADRNRKSLHRNTETRASPCGRGSNDNSLRDAGGNTCSTRRSSGKGYVVKAVGKKDRVGAPERRRTWQRKKQRWQGQRKSKRRPIPRERGQRQGKEVKKGRIREQGGSVVEEAMKPHRELASSEKGTGLGSEPGSTADAGEISGPGHNQTSVPGAWPASLFPDVAEGPTGPAVGSPAFFTRGRTYGELAEPLHVCMDDLVSQCGELHGKVQFSGGIFPLPENLLVLSILVSMQSKDHLKILQGVCKALNSYYGVAAAERRVVPAATRLALQAMADSVATSELCEKKFDGVSWDRFLEVRGVDYRGEEIKVAKSFIWENISPALPEAVGSIPLSEVCEGGTLDYILHFDQYLLPEESRVYTRPPKVFCFEEGWESICRGLVEKGVCRMLPLSEVFHVQGKPLFNGLFGVSKDEMSDGHEVYRLIMNLVPANKLMRNLGADVCTLPSITSLGPLDIGREEVLMLSSEDIRCFFYLFATPVAWHKFMAFGKPVPPSMVPDGCSEPHYLASRVLPMGFISSVAIAQHIHRRVARMSLHGIKPSRGPQCEMRKDKGGSRSQWLYRIYLDNFDTLERVDYRLAELIKGTPSPEVLAMRQGYLQWGMPRHPKKTVEQELQAEVQGAIVDGVTGRVKPKPDKVLKYVELAIALLHEGRATQKQMQIVCGGFVYCALFRRAMLGMLNSVWKFIVSFANDPPVIKRDIPGLVKFEIARFICAIPLAQMDLRAETLGEVTASDASEYGGGFCVSKGLSPMGVHAASCDVRGDLPDLDDHVQVLTVGLFDGIGALRVGADVLKLPMAGHVSAEVSKEGSRVLESNFPDSIQVGDVVKIDEEMVKQWATKYSNVGLVLVGGGPPCQGVSGLNADRKGALKDARSNLFVHVRRVYMLVKEAFRWCQVHFMMESVFSMDEGDRTTMSEHMGVIPFMVDASDISLCRRPRLYWLSWEIAASPYTELVPSSHEGWSKYVEIKFHYDVQAGPFLKAGWEAPEGGKLPTFTTARPRAQAGNRPAGLWQCAEHELKRWKEDEHRYPPYVYRDRNGLRDSSGNTRLPTIQEKEVIMGFPVDYTAACVVKSKQKGAAYDDVRHSLVGNSWHVPVITWLMHQLFRPLGLTPVSGLDDIMTGITPGRERHLQGYLKRLPLQQVKGGTPPVDEGELVRKLVSFVSVKGEDLMLQSETENSVKFHRLRSSVPAKLWKWKVVCGWPWRHPNFHINVLEMEAVLTCLRWRVFRKKHLKCRFLHLTDSMVTLHALSRGRSSSRKLRAVLSKINSLILASGVHPVWGYVATKQNPADRPSRRPVKKLWGKKLRS